MKFTETNLFWDAGYCSVGPFAPAFQAMEKEVPLLSFSTHNFSQ